VSPVKYELGFISQKTAFFIVTAVKTSNLAQSINSSGLEPATSPLVAPYGIHVYIIITEDIRRISCRMTRQCFHSVLNKP
jgi:hypothetical protein